MQIGMLYPVKDQKKAEKEFKEGKAILGVDPASLLDEIIVSECKHENNSAKVLAEVKMDLLQIIGKVEVKKEGVE